MAALPTPGGSDVWGANLNAAIESVTTQGLAASLPASGDFEGQVYAATDTGQVWRWDGATWAIWALALPEGTTDGDVPVWDATAGLWVPGAAGGGGGSAGGANVLIFGAQSPTSHINWNSVSYTGAYRGLQGGRDSSGAQNAEIVYDVTLEAGTYTLDLFHLAGPNRGIYNIQVAGSSVGTQDGYSSATNAAMSSITGIAVAGGRTSIRLLMATKSGSSSSYVGSLQGLGLTRTGA